MACLRHTLFFLSLARLLVSLHHVSTLETPSYVCRSEGQRFKLVNLDLGQESDNYINECLNLHNCKETYI